jgi:hypothetical protein
MADFFETYGIWIIIGLFFVYLLWRNVKGHSSGCCGGTHENVPEKVDKEGEPGAGKSSGCH